MERIATIDLDIAKQAFQVHGTEAAGAAILRRKLRRDDVAPFLRSLAPCRVGVEAGAGTAGPEFRRAWDMRSA